MKLIHVIYIGIGISIIISVLQYFELLDAVSTLLSYISWITMLIFSIFISKCFNKQSGIVQFLIGTIFFLSFLSFYILLSEYSENSIPYINSIWVGSVFAFIIGIIYSRIKEPNIPQKRNQEQLPLSPYKDIINGKITTEEHLIKYFESQSFEKINYLEYLQTLKKVYIDNEDIEENNREIVNKLVNPILEREAQYEYIYALTGSEHNLIRDLHDLAHKEGITNSEIILEKLKLITSGIVKYQKQIEDESKRNTQSLNISIAGILVSVILSILSFVFSDKGEMVKNFIQNNF